MTKLIDAINGARSASDNSSELLNEVQTILDTATSKMGVRATKHIDKIASAFEFDNAEDFKEQLETAVSEFEVERKVILEARRAKRKAEADDDDDDVKDVTKEECDDDEKNEDKNDDGEEIVDEDGDDDEDDDDDGDDDEDDDKMAKLRAAAKKKKESSKKKNESALDKMLAILEVEDSQYDEFKTVLRSEIKRQVKEVSENVESDLKKSFDEKIETVRDEAKTRVKHYVEKASAEFVETYGTNAVNEAELQKNAEFVESFVKLAREYNMSVDPELENVAETYKEQISERNEKIDELTDTLLEQKNTIMLFECDEISKEVGNGLAMTDKTRLDEMLNELEFSNSDDFKLKAESIREKFFSDERGSNVDEIVSENMDSNDIGIVIENDNSKSTKKKNVMEALAEIGA